jgi:hypothetical protein
MTHYFHHFKPRPNRNPKMPQMYDIYFSNEPTVLYGLMEFAEDDCRILNAMQVRAEQHPCQFEVEKLGEDKFTIVCKSHSSHSQS